MNFFKNIILFLFFLITSVSCVIIPFRKSNIHYNSTIDLTIDANYFGMHTTHFSEIPFRFWRLWDAYVFWPDLEKEHNQWHFETLDKHVEIAEKNNYTIVLTLGQTPYWAASNPYIKSPYGDRVKPVAPKSIDLWANYIRVVGTRYKGRIKYWEIWNEPDIFLFYNGSIQKMVELAKVAYEILKEIDKDNQIISPSITGWKGWPGGLWWLDMYLSLGGGKYCDIIGFHFYNGDLTYPEIAFTHIKNLYEILKRHKLLDKPVWNTESGFHLRRKFNELAAGYVARMHIINIYMGVDKFFWYGMDNEQFGWLYDFKNNKIKDSGIAYIEIQKWLIGKKIIGLRKENGIYICELNSKEKILWVQRGKKEFYLPKEWGSKKIWFLNGEITEIKNIEKINITETPVMILAN